MPTDHSSQTSVTLLGRLRHNPNDQAAWNDFVARYQPKILEWCRRWRLQESDAHDVTQAVLLKLSRLMATFAYDPSRSFRGWLKTLTHHAWRDLVDERKRGGVASGDSRIGEFFESLEAGDDLVRHLEEEFHRELMDQAMILVRPRVAARTWDAFRLTALEGCSGAAVGRPARDESRPGLRGKKRSKSNDPPGDPQAGRIRMNHCPPSDNLKRLLDRTPLPPEGNRSCEWCDCMADRFDRRRSGFELWRRTLGQMRNLRRRRIEHQVAPGQWSAVVTARLAVVGAVE